MSTWSKTSTTNPYREGDLVRWTGGRTVFRVVSTESSQMVAMVRADGKSGDDVTVTAPRNVEPVA